MSGPPVRLTLIAEDGENATLQLSQAGCEDTACTWDIPGGADCRNHALGPLQIVRLQGDGFAVRRMERHPAAGGTTRNYLFVLQLDGEACVSAEGRTLSFGPGDLGLLDAGALSELACSGEAQTVLMVASEAALRKYMPLPGDFCGSVLDPSHDLVSTVSAMVRGLWARLCEGMREQSSERAGEQLLSMVSGCYGAAAKPPAHRLATAAPTCLQIGLFVEQHLRDPELKAAMVARHFGISVSELNASFAASGETISGWVMRRRLEECASRLVDQQWARRRIADIAFSWGFKSAPQFTRCFRDQFGMSPSEYRESKSSNCSGLSLVSFAPEAKLHIASAA